jgi:hypothetical protein
VKCREKELQKEHGQPMCRMQSFNQGERKGKLKRDKMEKQQEQQNKSTKLTVL